MTQTDMPLHVYECAKGHVQEQFETIHQDSSGQRCGFVSSAGPRTPCRAKLKLSAAVTTAKPKFVRGVGGFYSPTN